MKCKLTCSNVELTFGNEREHTYQRQVDIGYTRDGYHIVAIVDEDKNGKVIRADIISVLSL